MKIGGAWGIALLASYMMNNQAGRILANFLADDVFRTAEIMTVHPTKEDVEGFDAFLKRYRQGLAIERTAVESID
jgi:hypothetical protein